MADDQNKYEWVPVIWVDPNKGYKTIVAVVQQTFKQGLNVTAIPAC